MAPFSPLPSMFGSGHWFFPPTWMCWACGDPASRPVFSIFTVTSLPSTVTQAVPEAPESFSSVRWASRVVAS